MPVLIDGPAVANAGQTAVVTVATIEPAGVLELVGKPLLGTIEPVVLAKLILLQSLQKKRA